MDHSVKILSEALYHVENLQRVGYTVIKGLNTEQECSEVISDYYDWIERNREYAERFKKANIDRYSRLCNFHCYSSNTLKLFEKEFLLSVLDLFWGNRTTCIYTSLYFEEGTQQPIHRDAPLFCTFPENLFLGVWFALENANETNGALEVVPYGHILAYEEYESRRKIVTKLNKADSSISFSDNDLWLEYQEYVNDMCERRNLSKVTLAVDAGDVVVWHPMLPHGGSKISSPGKTRHSIVMHVVPEGVEVHGCYLFFNMQGNFVPRNFNLVKGLKRSMWDMRVEFMQD